MIKTVPVPVPIPVVVFCWQFNSKGFCSALLGKIPLGTLGIGSSPQGCCVPVERSQGSRVMPALLAHIWPALSDMEESFAWFWKQRHWWFGRRWNCLPTYTMVLSKRTFCFPHCFLLNAFSGDHSEENKHKLRAVNPGIDVSASYTIVFLFCRQHLYCFTNGLSEVLVHWQEDKKQPACVSGRMSPY